MSNYNPYAAPTAGAPQPGGPGPIVAGPAQPWSPGETTSLAWENFKRCWGVLVTTYFVSSLISEIPQQIPGILQIAQVVEKNSAEYWTVYGICMFVGFVIQMFFQPGLIKIWLTTARGGTPGFGDLFSGASRYLPILAASFLSLLAILVGYVLFIVPGIIIGLGLMLAQFYVVDAEMGPIEGMKASWEATKGHKGNLFVFSLIGMGLAMLGLVMCCIGLYVTFPIWWVGLAIIYVRLSGRGTTSAGYTMPPQGPYGYGQQPFGPPQQGQWGGYTGQGSFGGGGPPPGAPPPGY